MRYIWHWRGKHKNLEGTGVKGLRKYKVARTTPQEADERGGGGGGDWLPPFFSGQFPDIIYIIG